MKIGLIVHSYTGNTLSVITKLQQALQAKGHEAVIERVSAENEDPAAAASARLAVIPITAPYDHLVFAAPVRGFSLSKVMQLYLDQLPVLSGKKVGLLVTQMFPFAWMGGNRAIKQFRAACMSKDCEIAGTAIINWSSRHREQQIIEVVESFQMFLQ